MKSNKYISGLFVAMTLVSSCNSDDMPQIAGDNNVKVSASISDMQTRTNAEGNGGSFSAGDKIVLTNITNNTTATYITADGKGSFAPEGEEAVAWAPSVKNNFRAYSPVSASYESFEIPSDQSTVEGIRSADWLKAEALNVVRPNDATLAINFKHQLAKVTMTINEYTGSMAGANVASYTPTDVVLNSAAKIAGNGAEYGLHAIAPYVVVDNSAGKHSFVALVAPQAYKSGDIFMSFTLNGRTYKVMANADLCKANFLVAGKNYCFNLTVDGVEEVSIGSVSVLDWEEGNVVNNMGGNLSSSETSYNQEATLTIDPNNPTHAIIQAGKSPFSDSFIDIHSEIPAGITDLTIKGLPRIIDWNCAMSIKYYLKNYNVVVEDVEKFCYENDSQSYNYDKILTFADATSISLLDGGYDKWVNNETGNVFVPAKRTIKALKPLEYVSSLIRDYKKYAEYYEKSYGRSFNFPYDLYPNNSKSEMTLYLSANQKKMVLAELIEDYYIIKRSDYDSDDLYIYRSTDENFWASGEKEKSNFEFCGITYKKIIKIQ